MNPIAVAAELRESYVAYLSRTFGLSEAAAELQQCFLDLLTEPGRLVIGPYLEGTAPYEPAQVTLADLVGATQLLHPHFQAILAKPAPPTTPPPQAAGFGFGQPAGGPAAPLRDRVPGWRRLYAHQVHALERLCGQSEQDCDRHTVVSSGTGSGKTECFLLPAIDWILRHPTRVVEQGGLRPGSGRGLRALLVYPMNALVNDQVRRLRHLVGFRRDRGEAAVPVTFARYTSETRETRPGGLEREPDAPDNQLLGRQEILTNPPDILITNFAMLEQALLRPRETPLFEQIDEFAWRFLILDEAHSYRGAQAIELARLMQRVRAAVRRGRQLAQVAEREPVCVATSATLTDAGTPEDEARRVTADFVRSLFGVPFDPQAAVILARRIDPATGWQPWSFADAAEEERAEAAWASDALGEALGNLTGAPDEAFRTACAAVATPAAAAAAKEAPADRRAYLHHLLRQHPRFHWLWEHVRARPARFEDLARQWHLPEEQQTVALANLVAACNAARLGPEEQRLLPCRYHLFASALEGLFADLGADGEAPAADWAAPQLAVRALDLRRLASREGAAFELARCAGCGYPFVVVDPQAHLPGVDAPPAWQRPVAFLAFAPEPGLGGQPLPAQRVNLRSGTLEGDDLAGEPPWRTLYRVPGNGDSTDVRACPYCGRDAQYYTVAGRFLTGQDAPVSILTAILYEQLPALAEARLRALREQYRHRFLQADHDPQVGGARKLLMFSDSRQNAAFMASYVQDRATEYLIRWLAFQALSSDGEARSLDAWANAVVVVANAGKLQAPFFRDPGLADDNADPFRGSYEPQADADARRRRVLGPLLAELAGTQRLSLESLGLLQVDWGLEQGPGLYGPAETVLSEPLDWPGPPITLGDLRDLVERVFRLMRRQFALTGLDSANLPAPGRGGRTHYLVLARQEGQGDLHHEMYREGSRPTFYMDLLQRWAGNRCAGAPSEAQVRGLLDYLFRGIAFLREQVYEEDGGLCLRAEAARLARPRRGRLWLCDRCGSYCGIFLAGTCPTPRCQGVLRAVPEEQLPERNPDLDLFVRWYASGQRAELRAEEHTAQLSPDLGQQVQEAFQCGQVTLLSCSTTFEMGIDIGDLQALVLRNMPPGPVNYLQRAGRAGRRSDTVAFVLTYCQRRPHDRHYFGHPLEMLAGSLRPPRIDLGNERILRRHCNAEALAEYGRWLDRQCIRGRKRDVFERGGDVGAFFDDVLEQTGQSPAEHLRTWLVVDGPGRGACRARLREAFGLDGRQADRHLDLLPDLSNETVNPLARATAEVRQLLKAYRHNAEQHRETATRLEREAAQARQHNNNQGADQLGKDANRERGLAGTFDRLVRQLRAEYLPRFLMGRGVLPSFAFPVNVVRLHALRDELRDDAPDEPRLRLERDGKVGLADYAPGAEVVAGKRVYTSVGLRKYPALEFSELRWFRLCNTCGHLHNLGVDRPESLPPECPVCGNPVRPVAPRLWVKPTWGYVTDRSARPTRPQGQRPQRVQTTRSYFLGGRPAAPETVGLPNEEKALRVETVSLPNEEEALRVEGAYAEGRTLLVLNLGEFEQQQGYWHRAGFLVCSRCGRADFSGENRPGRHRAPYHESGRYCTGPVGLARDTAGQNEGGREPVALGHPYETDALWLEFHDTSHGGEDAGFWLSVAYALAHAAADELDIERGDLDATCVPLEHLDRQAVVLFDTVPGGAGHCRQIARNLAAVITQARERLAECDCEPTSTGCYGCLCDYANQHAHPQLSRGPALAYLARLADALSQGGEGPWRRVHAPERELLDTLGAAQGKVEIAVSAIQSNPVAGLNRDWFDVVTELARRPAGADQLVVRLGHTPDPAASAAEALAYHALAKLGTLGARLELFHSPPKEATVVIDRDSPSGASAWRWPWAQPMGPGLAEVHRSRLGRETQALAELPILPQAKELGLVLPVEFRHFTLVPNTEKNIGDDKYFGALLRAQLVRLLLIDPHILRSKRDADVLDRFLKSLRPVAGCVVRIRAASPRPARNRSGSDYTDAQYGARVDNLLAGQGKRLGLEFDLPGSTLKEHDRILLWHVRHESDDRYYRVMLGQGLVAFAGFCNRRSEGVVMRIDSPSFEREWTSWASAAR